MSWSRRDPGACPICGAAHTACTPDGHTKTISVPQMPARDRRALGSSPVLTHDETLAEVRQHAPKAESTKTYRGDPNKRRRNRTP